MQYIKRKVGTRHDDRRVWRMVDGGAGWWGWMAGWKFQENIEMSLKSLVAKLDSPFSRIEKKPLIVNTQSVN